MEQYRVLTKENRRYPVGITVMDKKLHVSVISSAETCSLVLFENGNEEPDIKIPMAPKDREGDVWNLTVEGK